jgi:tRNA (guanine37-N1)-methyltransferase
MRPEPLSDALDSIKNRGKIIYFSPRGATLNQKMVREFTVDSDATYTLICGRYEGIDQRIIDEYDITELSIGDYKCNNFHNFGIKCINSLCRQFESNNKKYGASLSCF